MGKNQFPLDNSFRNATFHFKEDPSSEPEDSKRAARWGIIFPLLTALTAYTLGWVGGKMAARLTKR